MSSLTKFKALIGLAGAMALCGCLVSEEPILNAQSGTATPLDPGNYSVCPIDDEADEDDCELYSLVVSEDGLHLFSQPDAEAEDSYDGDAQMRMRRIGRDGYAIQSLEGDSYVFYYGAGDSEEFRLEMMLCADLPEDLRSRLIERGDLEAEDEDFEACVVKTQRALVDAAKAYHRGDIESDERIALLFTPAAMEDAQKIEEQTDNEQ